MIVASLIVAIGVFSVAAITQLRGLRLGGTIVIGVLAVYTLIQFLFMPLFIISTIFAYLGIRYVRENTLLYGRDEFVVGIAAGSLTPIGVLLLAFVLPRLVELQLDAAAFIGSILPGLTAYNYHQLRPEYRSRDFMFGIGLLAVLLALGAFLVSPQTTWLAQYTPLVLFSETADIAVLRNAIVEGSTALQIPTRPHIVILLAIAMVLAEASRRKFGLRLGTITLGLLAIYTVANWHLLVLFVVTTAIVYGIIHILHRATMLYGRVLLGLGAGTGVLLTIPIVQYLHPVGGLSALVVGILAGITAFNIHVTPGLERRQSLSLSIVIFTGMLLLARLTITPLRHGFPQEFGLLHVAIGVIVILVGVVIARYYQIDKPSDEAVLSTSILRGGEG